MNQKISKRVYLNISKLEIINTMSEIYAINNLDGYASEMRELAAKNLSDNYTNDNLDDYITLSQIINLIKSECLGFDEHNRIILNEEINNNIFEKTSVWIFNSGLSKLASKNLVECAWDDNNYDMIFWASNSENNHESKSNTGRKNTKNKRSNS
jgi:hypothetical protein